jgi:hypothetical protein
MAWSLEAYVDPETKALPTMKGHDATTHTAEQHSAMHDSRAGLTEGLDGRSTWHVVSKWLATRPPPKGGLKPKQNKGFTSALGERRTMSMCAFHPALTLSNTPSSQGTANNSHSGHLPCVVTAASDATLSLASFSLDRACWQPLARSLHHKRPVLSIAHVVWQCPAATMVTGERGAGVRDVVFTGATDGSVAMWDVPAAAACLPSEGPSWPSTRGLQCSEHEVALLAWQPAWSHTSYHQSGVNAMVALALPGCGLLVTGGDDQALKLARLSWAGPKSAVQTTGACEVPCAHASSIKGVDVCHIEGTGAGSGGTGAVYVCSVGLDQFLRVWKILEDSKHMEGHSNMQDAPAGSAEVAWGAGRSQGALERIGDAGLATIDPSSGCPMAAARSEDLGNTSGTLAQVWGAGLGVAEVLAYKLDVSEPTCVSGSLEQTCDARVGEEQSSSLAGMATSSTEGSVQAWAWHLVVGGRGTQTLDVCLFA